MAEQSEVARSLWHGWESEKGFHQKLFNSVQRSIVTSGIVVGVIVGIFGNKYIFISNYSMLNYYLYSAFAACLIKGNAAIAIAREFSGRSRNFSGGHLGHGGILYREDLIREYIRDQEKEDIRLEQLKLV